jgi:hypothetical protein
MHQNLKIQLLVYCACSQGISVSKTNLLFPNWVTRETKQRALVVSRAISANHLLQGRIVALLKDSFDVLHVDLAAQNHDSD